MSLPIVYCVMCQDNLYQLDQIVNKVAPFVDYVVIVDGGSRDCSLFHFRNREDEGIHIFLHPWSDNFSGQRNNYIKRAREVAGSDDFWMLVSDPDEHFEHDLLFNLLNIQKQCEDRNLNSAMFRCRSVTLRGNRKIWENLDDYYKLLFYRYKCGIHYEGNPHEFLVIPDEGHRPLKTEFVYEHIKWEEVIWERGCRNSWVNGGGDNVGDKNLLWVELKSLVKEYYGKDLTWAEYQKELINATIPETVKDWMINKARLDSGWSGASEMKEHYKYFYRFLHKNLEPENLKGTHIE